MKFPILSRLRDSGAASRAEGGADGERYTLAAEIPGLKPGKPLLRINIEMHSEPQGDGERLRLRAHWQANFASALAPALAAPASRAHEAMPPSAEKLPAERVSQWLRRRLDNPLLRALAEPLLRHDFNSWVELRASTADLAGGAGALLPETDRLKALGIEPKLSDPKQDAPLAQSWAGSSTGPRPGFAQVSLLQLDKRHLPPALAAMLGARPFQLAAAVVNVVEEDPGTPQT
ncbi:MAG TPA: hypothetical protein VNX47_10285 [Nevskia sp.]|nr:hypothetical protein [Nevskia sp.]